MENARKSLKLLFIVLMTIELIAVALKEENQPEKTVAVFVIAITFVLGSIIFIFVYWEFERFFKYIKNKKSPAQEIQLPKFVNQAPNSYEYDVRIQDEKYASHTVYDLEELLRFGENELKANHWAVVRLGLFKMREQFVTIVEPESEFSLEIQRKIKR